MKIYLIERMGISYTADNGKIVKYQNPCFEPLFAEDTREEAEKDIQMLQTENEKDGYETYYHIEEIVLYQKII